MACLVRTFLTKQHVLISENNDHNPLTMSDELILEEIYSTHVHSHTKFDAESLFNIAADILKRSTHVVENVVQGRHVKQELYNTHPPASFTSPLCTLKQINSEMSCKVPGEEIAFKTTLAILEKLSQYSWTAKGVLTLSAFAIEYGEFWMLSEHQSTEPIAKSLAILKRVPQLTNLEALKKHHNAILELNTLIKTTLQVIDIIIELERLSSIHGINAVPLEQFPVDVFWVIITIVAIVTQIECLTTDSDKRQNLSQFGQKINIIISKLRNHVAECAILIAEAEYMKTLRNLFQTPTEVMEVFKVLIFHKDAPQEAIYDGSTKTLVKINELKTKDVLLLISTLDISDEDITMLIPIYERLKREQNQYKIMWIPIVEEWNDKQRKQFNSLKSKMPWYVLHHFAPIKGIKYIKEELHFMQKPLFVVLNPKGMILHDNAFHMIQVWGVKAFPFTKSREIILTKESMWIDSLLVDIDIKIKWEEEKCVIIYGGTSATWIEQFTEAAGKLASDTSIKQTNTTIELFSLAKENKNVVSKFWNKVESLFVTKMHDETNTITQQVEKLLSYKNEDGWAIVTQGSVVAFVGHGKTVLTTIKESGKWIGGVSKKGLQDSLKDYHNIVAKSVRICSHLEIHNAAGKVPDFIVCPDCNRTMEVFITYKCCHINEDKANGDH
ncbi:protein SIEVE ELEMENT OCCLUSION B-like [Trifolium pratense]|nr:protein SIEVE ELEMENT OCCLUSION B-like [Trifolium pratense]